MKKAISKTSVLGLPLLLAALLAAQEKTVDVMVHSDAHGTRTMKVTAFAPQGGTYTFVAAQAGLEGRVVKNKPFSAEGITETVRTLADGTKITQKSTSKIYRDSQGRTRREMTLGGLGPLASEHGNVTTVTINDPVSQRMFVSRKGSGHAKEFELIHEGEHEDFDVHPGRGEGEHEIKIIKKRLGSGDDVDVQEERNVWVEEEDHGGLHTIREHDLTAVGPKGAFFSDEDASKEDLGERVIEGVVARGVKTTTVIPEGKIGNDGPITITRERWYSDELEAVVMTKTNDPLSGVVTYKLTNINRAEPDPSLFEAPEDVTIEEGHSIKRRIKVERSGGPEQQ